MLSTSSQPTDDDDDDDDDDDEKSAIQNARWARRDTTPGSSNRANPLCDQHSSRRMTDMTRVIRSYPALPPTQNPSAAGKIAGDRPRKRCIAGKSLSALHRLEEPQVAQNSDSVGRNAIERR
ncbi:Hypp9284 [Branchiostoma lanceolatum]|uniref:Hypp9284 protein n=1 Tax=Branchiostoma lanceolatum TaxID=7740 RepID=A0A8J9ZFZ4_BRALA|nr:Hypp9284 [Branchiostoma lanceolatum]